MMSKLDSGEKLYLAVSDCNEDLCRTLLQVYGYVDIDYREAFGKTPLSLACKSGYTKIVDLLLEHRANTDAADYYGITPLMYACNQGHTEIVKLLLQVALYRSREAIVRAVDRGYTEIVKLLLETSVGVDTKDEYDNTLLIYAVENGQIEMVELLLEKGADIDVTNGLNEEPIVITRRVPNGKEIRRILESYKKNQRKDDE